MSVPALLLACVLYDAAFAVFHVAFWKIFDWRRVLRAVPFVDRQILQILNICMIFVFSVFAWLCLTFSEDLVASDLGRAVLGAMAVFWALRALLQMLFFGVRHAGSALFFVAFLAGALLHAWPILR